MILSDKISANIKNSGTIFFKNFTKSFDDEDNAKLSV